MTEWTAGEVAGVGTFHCVRCEYRVSLNAIDQVPTCPRCYGTSFVRSSLFAGPDTQEMGLPQLRRPRSKVRTAELRRHLRGPGSYLSYRTEHDGYRAVLLPSGSTRIGRSESADVRFDDPTVSRRHALVVRQPDGVHILDDRSLNGVFVNGQRVEWRLLNDGDEIVIGRHRLDFIEASQLALGSSTLRPTGRGISVS